MHCSDPMVSGYVNNLDSLEGTGRFVERHKLVRLNEKYTIQIGLWPLKEIDLIIQKVPV